MLEVGQVCYRAVERHCSNGTCNICFSEWVVVAETPSGHWFESRDDGFLLEGQRERKWNGKSSRSRFCSPTKDEALGSLVARKRRQISICRAQAERAGRALIEAQAQRVVLRGDAPPAAGEQKNWVPSNYRTNL